MAQTLGTTSYGLTKGTEEQAYIDALETAVESIAKATLSAAAEAGNAIVVTGTVNDLFGVAKATQRVQIISIPTTDGQGTLTGGTGTEATAQADASGANFLTTVTDASGVFTVSVANTAAEQNTIIVLPEGGLATHLVLTFA